jgi:hypothetical protein
LHGTDRNCSKVFAIVCCTVYSTHSTRILSNITECSNAIFP